MLWHVICRYAGACLVSRAHLALERATDDEVADTAAARLGLITPVIRAAGQKGKAGEASALAFVELAARRGFSLDEPSPGFAAWEQWLPPLTVAASYGFTQVVNLLLASGASPLALDEPDHDNALHAALEHADTLSVLLAHSPTLRRLVNAPNKYGRTPFVAALIAEPHKATHRRALALLAPHAALSDDDYWLVRTQRKLARLQACIFDARLTPPRPVPARSTRFWDARWHWSFPASDRAAVRLTYLLAKRHGALPAELWLCIFAWVERGWFVPRRS